MSLSYIHYANYYLRISLVNNPINKSCSNNFLFTRLLIIGRSIIDTVMILLPVYHINVTSHKSNLEARAYLINNTLGHVFF